MKQLDDSRPSVKCKNNCRSRKGRWTRTTRTNIAWRPTSRVTVSIFVLKKIIYQHKRNRVRIETVTFLGQTVALTQSTIEKTNSTIVLPLQVQIARNHTRFERAKFDDVAINERSIFLRGNSCPYIDERQRKVSVGKFRSFQQPTEATARMNFCYDALYVYADPQGCFRLRNWMDVSVTRFNFPGERGGAAFLWFNSCRE